MHASSRSRRFWPLVALLAVTIGPLARADTDNRAQPRVVNNDIVSVAYPCARITIQEPLRYFGRHSFEINDVARGERLVFVRTHKRHITHLWIAQFEQILPESTETYRYGFQHSLDIGGLRFNPSAFAFSNRKAAADNPADEAALTAKFLRHHGYEIDDELMGARFAAVPDPLKRHELIVFYFENVATTGHTIGELYAGESAQPLWAPIAETLIAHGRSSFQLVSECK